MFRALRIVGIASLVVTSVAVTGVAPAGAAVTITQVSALTTHAGCSRMSDGTVRCSGQNESGQLGTGNAIPSLNPVVVRNTANSGPLVGVAQVVTGNFYACARLQSGTAVCWGDNTYGQLGNGTSTSVPTAIPVVVRNPGNTGALTGIAQIAAGKYHTCARLTNGTVSCWGHNGYYELGDGTNISRLLPKTVLNGAGHAPLTGQINISISQYHSCSVQSDGSARCWGLNLYGTLGEGTQKPKALPTRVKAPSGSAFLAKVTSINAAPNHTCALLKTGTMMCWGLNNFGQLGDNTNLTRFRPVNVKNVLGTAALIHIAQITVGGGSEGDHTCARLVANTALCWGANGFGQLGDGTRVNKKRPSIVRANTANQPFTKVTSIVAGPIDTCAVITGGQARCWGFNSAGQFGNGKAFGSNRPIPANP